MESILSASKSALVSSLDYSLEGNKPPGASYILASHELAAFQRGTQIADPSVGTRQVLFEIQGTSSAPFIRADSISFRCDIRNKSSTHPLEPLGFNWGCMISQARIYLGGQLIEDVRVNATEWMLHKLQSHEKKIEGMVEAKRMEVLEH